MTIYLLMIYIVFMLFTIGKCMKDLKVEGLGEICVILILGLLWPLFYAAIVLYSIFGKDWSEVFD